MPNSMNPSVALSASSNHEIDTDCLKAGLSFRDLRFGGRLARRYVQGQRVACTIRPITPKGQPMLRLFIAASAVLAATACSSLAPASGSSKENRVHYRCVNGEEITVVFQLDGNLATLIRAGESFQLQEQVVASGIWYSNGRVSIRGKGDELRLEVGRMAPIACTAI